MGIAGRRRRFQELSLPRFAAWGAVGGLLLTLFPFAIVAVGLASREGSTVGTGQIVAVITPLFVLLSAASATVLGRTDNGRNSWRLKGSAITYAAWQDNLPSSQPATVMTAR